MNRLFTLLFTLIVLNVSAQHNLLHYWNFNGVINSSTPYDTAQSVILKPNNTIGGGALNYAGAFTDGITGDTVNERNVVANWIGLQNCLRLRSPYGPLTISLPTIGHDNIVVKYGLYKSSNGSGFETVTYTVDGIKWDSAGLIITDGSHGTSEGLGTFTVYNSTGAPLDLITLDFSKIPAVNNNPNFKVQINFDAAAKGNNRIDNLSCDGDPIAVPVTLTAFDATILTNKVQLSWESVNEVNLKEYQIEKSDDGISFTSVATKDANNAVAYSYTVDDSLSNHKQYYRLKLIDNNGQYFYSKIVFVVGNSSIADLTIFPNPAINTITITHPKVSKDAIIKILSLDGRQTIVKSPSIASKQTIIEVSQLVKGCYIVIYANDGVVKESRFIKK